MATRPPDPYAQVLRRASQLAGWGLVLTLIGAALTLNRWPGSEYAQALSNPSLLGLINAINGYSLLIAILFWATCPPPSHQRFVFVGWLALTPLLYLALSEHVYVLTELPGRLSLNELVTDAHGIVALPALLLRIIWPRPSTPPGGLRPGLGELALIVFIFSLVPSAALDLTVALHPLTLDLYIARFDTLAGLMLTPALVGFIDPQPWLGRLVALSYGLTPLTFLALCIHQLRSEAPPRVHAVYLWVVMTGFALLAYHLFPITGPKYVFGPEFARALADPGAYTVDAVRGLGPNPRNGMPSMHFGWALATCLVWGAEPGTRRRTRVLLWTIAGLVGVATLYLGEHYLSDLIVATPFVLGSIAFCRTDLAWRDRARWLPTVLGLGLWLLWVLLLRHGLAFFEAHPLAAQGLVGLTVVGVAAQYQLLFRPTGGVQDVAVANAPVAVAPVQRTLTVLFFITGFAALTYQVLFAKRLALIFGSTSSATFTVLMTFMGGMAVGSLIGDHLVRRTRRPIVFYALAEVCIAIYCVGSLGLLAHLQEVYRWVAEASGQQAWVISAARVLIGATVLLVPTVLMGATLPLLVKATSASVRQIGISTAHLYTSNTLGAALGALLSSYFIIAAVGARASTLLAALLNLCVALAALELAKRQGDASAEPAALQPVAAATALPAPAVGAGVYEPLVAGLILCAGGVLSLGLETVYVHLLSIVAGNSVYAFGLMLATFLFGLSIGGHIGGRLIERCLRPSVFIPFTQLGIALFVVLTGWGWTAIPGYFASFADHPLATTFAARETIRALVCALIMIPPTVFIGAGYALTMNAYATARPGRWLSVGMGSALNTLGNISGVVLFGFVVLPQLGGLDSALLIAAGSLGLSLLAAGLLRGRKAVAAYATGLATLAGLWVSAPSALDYSAISNGSNVYFRPQDWGRVIDHAESIDGGLTSVAVHEQAGQTIKTLLTNGKFQGNDAVWGEVKAQIGFAAIPLLHQSARSNALVIGYGTGMTSRVLHTAGFAHLDIAELSRDIIRLADTHFADLNARVSSAPRVRLHLADGRNLLFLSRDTYDLVSIEITSIWFAGAASLYNKEFYAQVNRHLKPGGVLQQWVQLHHMSPFDLLSVLATLKSEFAYVSLYVSGGQGILIASQTPETATPSAQATAALERSTDMQRLFSTYQISLPALRDGLFLNPTELDRFLTGFGGLASLWISTDDNLRLEYSTPKANAGRDDASFERNLTWLGRARHDATPATQLKP